MTKTEKAQAKRARRAARNEIEKGETLARAATPGGWSQEHETTGTFISGTPHRTVCKVYGASDADYLAHHSPDRLLALYADLRAALAYIETVVHHAGSCGVFDHERCDTDRSCTCGAIRRAVDPYRSEVSRGG
jgi:hypothetical protein